ncbi:hypothetical protein BDZ89DRAFT_1064751 [Hymenopellis radicata]|nr:hypothetical protein BDZ89DRAFT_1064751 [Hymenopellis radicata]
MASILPIKTSPSTSKASPLSSSSPTSSSAPSTRTRSATAKKAADNIEVWKNTTRGAYESIREEVEAAAWPRIVCYTTSTINGTLTPLSRDGDFGPIIKLIEIVGRLWLSSTLARDLVITRMYMLYGHRLPKGEHLIEFITKHFPNVIFKKTAKENSSVCGSVNKGEEEGADKNEMFISKDLVQVYLDTQAGRRPSAVTEIQFVKVKRFVEFVLISTILHELGHCLTKYFFGPQFVTPYLPVLVGSEQRGVERVGEIGQDIEMVMVGCIAALQWEEPGSFYFDANERLWTVDKLVGWVKTQDVDSVEKWYSLTDAQIDHVSEMVHHGYIIQIPFSGQREIGGASGKAIRAKFAGDRMNMIVQQEVIEDQTFSGLDSNTGSEYLPGLQITLNPLAIRSATSGDRKF